MKRDFAFRKYKKSSGIYDNESGTHYESICGAWAVSEYMPLYDRYALSIILLKIIDVLDMQKYETSNYLRYAQHICFRWK